MKILSILAGTLLFATVQFCGCGSCKVNAQTTLKTVTKEEPKTVKLKITGMTCAGCSNHVATTLKEIDGVIEQKVEYPGNVAIVKYNSKKTSVTNIIKAIEKLGYKTELQTGNKTHS